jgi:hypothetical protein
MKPIRLQPVPLWDSRAMAEKTGFHAGISHPSNIHKIPIRNGESSWQKYGDSFANIP